MEPGAAIGGMRAAGRVRFRGGGAVRVLALLAGMAWLAILAGCHQVHQARAQKLANSALELFAGGDFDKGLEHSEIALRLGSDNPLLHRARAMVFLQRGDADTALVEADAGLAMIARINADPHHPYGTIRDEILSEFHFIRGNTLQALGRLQEARDALAEAVKLDQKNTGAQNNLGWLLATSPVDHVRDGDQAVIHATAACEQTGWQQPGTLDTLAAARAEAGDFEAAIKWQAEALSLLGAPGGEDAPAAADDPEGYRARLDLYRAGRPFREDPKASFEARAGEGERDRP